MDNKEKVLCALIMAFKSNKDILDIMEMVNEEVLQMTYMDFSKAMYMLQKERKISGVEFEDDNPKKITMWDTVKIHFDNC